MIHERAVYKIAKAVFNLASQLATPIFCKKLKVLALEHNKVPLFVV